MEKKWKNGNLYNKMEKKMEKKWKKSSGAEVVKSGMYGFLRKKCFFEKKHVFP